MVEEKATGTNFPHLDLRAATAWSSVGGWRQQEKKGMDRGERCGGKTRLEEKDEGVEPAVPGGGAQPRPARQRAPRARKGRGAASARRRAPHTGRGEGGMQLEREGEGGDSAVRGREKRRAAATGRLPVPRA